MVLLSVVFLYGILLELVIVLKGGHGVISELITAEILKNVGLTIGQYIFGRVGDTYFDSFTAKRKLKKILKEDEKNIEQKFQENVGEAEIEKIKKFFFEDIFQDVMFLYPVSDFPEERSILLERRFNAYAEKTNWKICSSVNLSDLIACVVKHNKLVNKYLLSDSERIMLKTIQRNQLDLLGYIGKTLDSNSELQIENQTLDYTQKQIEGLLHAMRMDAKHYKLLMMIYSFGILMLITIAIITLPKILNASDKVQSISSGLVVITIFFALAAVLLLFLFCLSLKNVKIRENRVLEYMELLWQLHFERYKRIFAPPSQNLNGPNQSESSVSHSIQ